RLPVGGVDRGARRADRGESAERLDRAAARRGTTTARRRAQAADRPRGRRGGLMPTWPNVLSAVLRGESLSTDDAAWAMDEIMSGNATPAQVAGFAVALRAKGETPD